MMSSETMKGVAGSEFKIGDVVTISGYRRRRWWRFWQPKWTPVTDRYVCTAKTETN